MQMLRSVGYLMIHMQMEKNRGLHHTARKPTRILARNTRLDFWRVFKAWNHETGIKVLEWGLLLFWNQVGMIVFASLSMRRQSFDGKAKCVTFVLQPQTMEVKRLAFAPTSVVVFGLRIKLLKKSITLQVEFFCGSTQQVEVSIQDILIFKVECTIYQLNWKLIQV